MFMRKKNKKQLLVFITAIFVIVVITGPLTISELRAAETDSENTEFGMFNPFTLESIEGQSASSTTTLSSQTSPTVAPASGRAWIRVPYRPSLRSPYKPSL